MCAWVCVCVCVCVWCVWVCVCVCVKPFFNYRALIDDLHVPRES